VCLVTATYRAFFFQQTKRFTEAQLKEISDTLESATNKKITPRGPEELDLVRSGLLDTTAYEQVRATHEKVCLHRRAHNDCENNRLYLLSELLY
jgi:hypothetical protein